jgi:hypothetical protein
MSYPITQHQLSGTTQAVIDFYDMRKWGHDRVCGGHAIHAADGSKVRTMPPARKRVRLLSDSAKYFSR